MPSRREFLRQAAQLGAAFALPPNVRARAEEATVDGDHPRQTTGIDVNDVQSQLNATRVQRIAQPTSIDDVRRVLREARREGRAVSVAGGRHAMGGQQFGRDTILVDMTLLNNVLKFDTKRGQIEVGAGIEWPELIDYLNRAQAGQREQWTIREKQTGVDRVSLGGSLASNIHGRGLRHPPIICDVESFILVDAAGNAHSCSRREDAELFALAIGGYGLFGIITQVTLRLVWRTKVQRVVEIIPVKDLIQVAERRLNEGFEYGDCQYSTDLETDAAMHAGVFSCYRPVTWETPMPENQKQLSADQWAALYRLARNDKRQAFDTYSKYYRSTNGQVYWSDLHQLAGNFDSYRTAVDIRQGTEMITEVYVSKDAFVPFMKQVRQDFIDHGVDMTYGTIRFIEQDAESFLAWAQEPSVCIVCNLHVAHTDAGKKRAAGEFRRIIDRAIGFGGRYYLTYHRWASRKQVETCYPQFVEFLRLKRKYDSEERFQSDWYRHYKSMFADAV